ncbi:hypothetical protein KT71_001455 [Congregibacter litoralis KT71]|uniref:Uncharacterized protein n=1 Tax=Congregibacter litoralis KT71 TaxID=314285 RepID=V7HS58_9GAMM|nr:hypothetical protein KT71_001455 [Congregibacter litoralis KT71]
MLNPKSRDSLSGVVNGLSVPQTLDTPVNIDVLRHRLAVPALVTMFNVVKLTRNASGG